MGLNRTGGCQDLGGLGRASLPPPQLWGLTPRTHSMPGGWELNSPQTPGISGAKPWLGLQAHRKGWEAIVSLCDLRLTSFHRTP